jgi:hypothetical protein
MPWTPRFANYAGILPILQNARTIIERDIDDALTWSYGSNPPGDTFARIQFTQRHSDVYPLLTIEPAGTEFNEITGGVELVHTFAVSIFLTAAISKGNLSQVIDELPQNVIRYIDAVTMCFMSASPADWRVNLVSDQGKVTVSIGEITLGPLQEGLKEAAGKYFHSGLFGLTVGLTESE